MVATVRMAEGFVTPELNWIVEIHETDETLAETMTMWRTHVPLSKTGNKMNVIEILEVAIENERIREREG